jgi:hypothetical protein
MTESPHGTPSLPDTSPAAADPGESVEPAGGFGEDVDPDVITGDTEVDDTGEASRDITDAVRDRPDPPFRTPDAD